MNPYMNEDLMWERLKDIQREVENSRMHWNSRPKAAHFRAWLAGLFARWAAPAPVEIEDESTISDVA